MALWKTLRNMDKAVVAWMDATNVAFGGQVQSGVIDVSQYEDITIGRSATGGTYVFEIDWYAADLTTLLITEAVVVANATTVQKFLAAPGARFRVKNTDGAVNFSAHRTFVTL
jgi:hypothetical protein